MTKLIGVLLVSAGVLCAAGCASERMVEISVPPIESTQFNSKNLTPAEAVQIFRDVAAQIGFEVQGPFQQPTNYGALVNYTALPARNSLTGSAHLEVYISNQTTVFHCVAHDQNTGRKIVFLFEHALDQLRVPYSKTETMANPLNH